jgi:putative ABC transport system permease protein
MTFSAVGALLLAVSIVACWITARRVTRIDPAAALKQE